MNTLPIDDVVPRLVATLHSAAALVLTAAPGAGKSTRVPPALAKNLPGKVLLLQPRRIAAKALARRIASEQNWRLGGEVGYRVRFERSGDATTKLWVMTEGTLTRQLVTDPYLEGVSAVILDEFHERSLHTDIALAYLRELQTTVRDDLKIIVMSATIDPLPVSAFLGGCPVVDAPGRNFPITMRHWLSAEQLPIPERAARAAHEALADPGCGDILIFMPGAGDIRATERALAALPLGNVDVIPLHGSLTPDEQDRALTIGSRQRIIVSTNVAETSLTIPGVCTVIDSGQARVLYHDVSSGVEDLRLETISRFSADQRAGRAGRTAPGRCWRLWSPTLEARLRPATPPELQRVELSGILLLLKRLGYADTRVFSWFEAPHAERLAAAEALLHGLGATISAYGTLTPLGERLTGLSVPPRLGALLHHAAQAQCLHVGASIAALCAERDIRVPRRPTEAPADPAPCDAIDRLECLEEAQHARCAPHLRDRGIDPTAARQTLQTRDDLLQSWQGAQKGWSVAGRERMPDASTLCRLLLAAFPDRVARRSLTDPNRATMVGGITVEIDRGSALYADRGQTRLPLFIAIEVQAVTRAGKYITIVRQAAETDEAALAATPDSIVRRVEVVYNTERERVIAQTRWFYRDLSVREAVGETADAHAASACLVAALMPQVREWLNADDAIAAWLTRVAWLAQHMPELELPAFDDEQLRSVMNECASGCSSLAELRERKPLDWFIAELSAPQQKALQEHAPDSLDVPSGSAIRLTYHLDGPPILAVRLQELFGMKATPRIAAGRIPVLLHLLAPNYRVEQITSDLASFWANTYAHVRKDLRTKYPKHSWPDDPLTALAVAKGRPRQ